MRPPYSIQHSLVYVHRMTYSLGLFKEAVQDLQVVTSCIRSETTYTMSVNDLAFKILRWGVRFYLRMEFES
jgi:hypothetical protein